MTACLSTSVFLPTCLPACLPAYLPVSLPPFLSACLLECLFPLTSDSDVTLFVVLSEGGPDGAAVESLVFELHVLHVQPCLARGVVIELQQAWSSTERGLILLNLIVELKMPFLWLHTHTHTHARTRAHMHTHTHTHTHTYTHTQITT